jgi:hypothetical protein
VQDVVEGLPESDADTMGRHAVRQLAAVVLPAPTGQAPTQPAAEPTATAAGNANGTPFMPA